MSLQVIGFRVAELPPYKAGTTRKPKPLSRVFISHQAAIDFMELAKRQPRPKGFELVIESVHGAEGARRKTK